MRSKQGSITSLMNKIMSNPEISKANKEYVEEMLAFMRASGANTSTILKHLYCFEKYIVAIGRDVDAKKANRTEIEKAMAKIETYDLSHETKRNIKVVVKSFYKHTIGEDIYYPKHVAWIKTTVNKNKKILPEDILDEEEIMKLLDAATNTRDRAIIALLFDTGIRAGELLALRKKDIDMNGNPAHITVTGKTGSRRIPIMFSVPFLGSWIDMRKDMKANDWLWIGIGSWFNHNRQMDYSGLRMMLKKVAKRAKLDKRVYPHLFRHSRASNYANKLTEQQLKIFFGWTGDSKMAATYVHLSGRDIDNAVLQANGQTPKNEEAKPKLNVKVCPRCRNLNSITSTYCSTCGTGLDISTVMKEEDRKNALKDYAVDSAVDKKITEEADKDIIRRRKKR